MPFSEETLRRMRDFAAEAMGPLQEFLLQDIARRIKGAGEITATAAYQIYRARALGESKRAIKKAIRQQLNTTDKEIERLYTNAARESYQIGTSRIDRPAPPWETAYGLQQVVAAAVKLAQRDFTNITQTIGMVGPAGRALPVQKAYRRCMDFTFEKVASGAQDYESAIRDATRELADKGVRVIDYESGRHASIETAARRCLMGGLGLLNEQIEAYKHDELGMNGWEISAHAASAPDHEPIQGRQYTDAEFRALNGTTERPGTLKRRIGTLNCTHYAFAVLLGVQAPVYTPEQLRQMAEANAQGVTYRGKHYSMYEATQQQRRLEAAIRRQKLACVVYEGSGQAGKLLTAQVKLQQLRQEYKAFSKAAGMPEQNARQQVSGFGRGQAARARAAAKAAGDTYKDRTFQIYELTPERVAFARWESVSEQQAQNLQAAHKELLHSLQGGDPACETGGYLDKDFKLIHANAGQSGEITLSAPPQNAIGSVHTHPSGELFSLEDVFNFTTRGELNIMTVVGNNGAVYVLEKTDTFDFAGLGRFLQGKLDQQKADFRTSPDLYINFMEDFLHEAERYGLGYWRFGAR